MFKKDTLNVARQSYETQNGMVVYNEPVTVYENVPCHLSISLNNTTKEHNIPYLFCDYTLFLNYNSKIQIKENDILYITTFQGQEYKLFAGEIKIYARSIQIKCKQEKIIESGNI